MSRARGSAGCRELTGGLRRPWPWSRRRTQEGVLAVELALLLPLVVTLFVSLIGVQRIYTAHIALAGAVREGVRAAALSEDSADRAVRRAAPALAASRLRVEVSRQPCRPGSPVQVTGTYRMLSRVPLAGSGGFELRSTAVMRCGG